MRTKPLIAIGPHYVKNQRGKGVLGCYENYIGHIERAGGTAIILTPAVEKIDFFLQMADGILLTGGDDIHPKYFRERPLPGVKLELSPDIRTAFDILIIKEAIKRHLPILGICLGCQTLNVALGGTLYQDIRTQVPTSRDHQHGTHNIKLDPTSLLRKTFNRDQIRINSRHHQAIKTPGKGLRVNAISTDGIIEGIEHVSHPFALGVQWHPEEMHRSDSAQRLFKRFVQVCR